MYSTGKKTPGGAETHTGHTGHTGARGLPVLGTGSFEGSFDLYLGEEPPRRAEPAREAPLIRL